MNIQQLRLFSDIVKYGSINQAALVNFMSPSSLSRAIHELERVTNTVLFQRSHTGMKLTKEGEEFFMMVQPILHNIQQLERAYSHESSIKDLLRLTICVQQNSIATECLIEFYNTYAATAKYVDIVMAAYSSLEEATDIMLKKHFMLAIVQYNSVQEKEVLEGFKHKRLHILCRKSTQVHVALNAFHPLAQRESLTMEDLKDYTRICYIDESLPDINYSTDADSYTHSSTIRRILIKERGQLINLLEYTDAYFLGTSPCKLFLANKKIRAIPLEGLNNEPVTVLLGYKDRDLNTNAQRFANIFKKVVSEM